MSIAIYSFTCDLYGVISIVRHLDSLTLINALDSLTHREDMVASSVPAYFGFNCCKGVGLGLGLGLG